MNCRVVLVRPQTAANLGATARVMRNFGLTDLVLVAPLANPADADARRLSTHGEDVLDRCRTVPELADAVADCVLVTATSARTGGLFRRQSCGTPQEIMPHLVERTAQGPVALVFGPESTGLLNTEIARCHYLLHIPTDDGAPALNLAQAVAICLYELRIAEFGLRNERPATEIAPFADQERAFDNLRVAMEEVHFLYGDKAESLMHALRHFLGRAGPTPMEVELLFGLARQLRWFVRNGPRLEDEQ
jgi:tRNA/rRNA methyltransferase